MIWIWVDVGIVGVLGLGDALDMLGTLGVETHGRASLLPYSQFDLQK